MSKVVHIGVLSKGEPQKVKSFRERFKDIADKCFRYVGAGEEGKYIAAGAPQDRVVEGGWVASA